MLQHILWLIFVYGNMKHHIDVEKLKSSNNILYIYLMVYNEIDLNFTDRLLCHYSEKLNWLVSS